MKEINDAELHFNSIKVQLEPKPSREGLLRLLFQFHKGTIRTQFKLAAKVFKSISIP